MMKKNKADNDWHGLVPQYFPELTKYVEKEFDPEKLQKRHPNVFDDRISINDQADFFITVVFSLARQIPSTWKNSKVLIPNDPFINLYIRDFVIESYTTYLEYCNGIEPTDLDFREDVPTSYDMIFFSVYEELKKLYKSPLKTGLLKEHHNLFQKYKLLGIKKNIYVSTNKYRKLHEHVRKCVFEDYGKIASRNPKKPAKLKWDDVLHGGRKTIKHCNLLRDYISKNYFKTPNK